MDEKALIAEKWEYFRECKSSKRKRLKKHSFKFCVDDIGAGWEYVHFELDGRNVDSFRVSYIGPTVRSFVDIVTNLKEKDFEQVVFYDEPGEYPVLISRRRDAVFIKLPHMDDGFFLNYEYFVNQILEEFNRVY